MKTVEVLLDLLVGLSLSIIGVVALTTEAGIDIAIFSAVMALGVATVVSVGRESR